MSGFLSYIRFLSGRWRHDGARNRGSIKLLAADSCVRVGGGFELIPKLTVILRTRNEVTVIVTTHSKQKNLNDVYFNKTNAKGKARKKEEEIFRTHTYLLEKKNFFSD